MTTFDALSGLTNACQATPNIVTGGQPTAEQIVAFKKAGGGVVLDIRDPMEPRPLNEPKVAKEAGLEYVNVPVVSGQVSEAQIEKITEVLRANAGKQFLFHCASANRVGGSIIPCLREGQTRELVQRDANTAARVGAQSTPTFLIEGILVGGAYPAAVFRHIIDSLITAKAGR